MLLQIFLFVVLRNSNTIFCPSPVAATLRRFLPDAGWKQIEDIQSRVDSRNFQARVFVDYVKGE